MNKPTRSTNAKPRMHGRFRRDRNGAGGIMEELPAFTVVVISLTVFIAASYNATVSFTGIRDAGTLEEDASSYLRAFRSYERILERGLYTQEPITGHFDPAKLDTLNSSALRLDLNPRHPYNVTVRDLVSDFSWGFGEPVPTDGGRPRVRESTAAVMALEDGGRNPALLTVVMW